MTHRPTTRKSSRGLARLPLLIGGAVLLLGLVVGLAVWLTSAKKSSSPPISQNTPRARDNDDSALARIKNFYDCVEASGSTYQPGNPGSCVVQGRTFAEPATFSEDSVRGAERLPSDGRAPVYSLANDNFDACIDKKSADQTTIATTQVLSVLGSDFMYVGASCDVSYNVVFVKLPDGTWRNVSRSTDKIACSVVDQYKIPKELFTRSSDLGDRDATCRNGDGTARAIQYEYQPSA